MCELQSLLNDPGESYLSILLNSGDAAYTFQQEVFRWLNIQDARHLRKVSRRLNEIVCGEPRDILTHVSPNVATVSTENSTLRLLGAHCNGERLPSGRRCNVGPRDNVHMAICTGIPPPLDPNGMAPCRRDVCRRCVRSAARHFSADEQHRLSKGHEVDLCRTCQLYETRRNPGGFSSCICSTIMHNGYKCDACRYSTLIHLIDKDHKATILLLQTHRDRQGNMFARNNIRRRKKLACPGCGGTVRDPDGAAAAVICCMACKGIEVKATTGTSFQASRAVPVAPTKRSARIAAINAAKPALSFTPS